VRAADKNAFRKYSKLGYSHLHNWIANAVLRKVSDKEDANIAFTAVPFKTDDYVKDEFT